ncbi:MAG: hypothetical protein GDA54_06900 [Alphaproteobacteria bacterium GM7ARS4]|nr:hypothetical protein [Alphaproteobacteria bacterium GM7ARS4]
MGNAPTAQREGRSLDTAWEAIFRYCKLVHYQFDTSPYTITATDIKSACQHLKKTGEKEVRILCKQDTRDSRPSVFKERGLFLLPVKNGIYKIVKGEGYMDIPSIDGDADLYRGKLGFTLESAKVGNSEMQHLDFAYAQSVIRSFVGDDSLVLSIRGRKFTPQFSFRVGRFFIEVQSVQTEVDAGYEGVDTLVLVEAKNSKTDNTIIRQLYYPYRQWSQHVHKPVIMLFFEKRGRDYMIWQYDFADKDDYNSVYLVKKGRYRVSPLSG